jgi:hypothetical protein
MNLDVYFFEPERRMCDSCGCGKPAPDAHHDHAPSLSRHQTLDVRRSRVVKTFGGGAQRGF